MKATRAFILTELLIALLLVTILLSSGFLLVSSLPHSLESGFTTIQAAWHAERILLQEAHEAITGGSGLTTISIPGTPFFMYVSGVNRDRYGSNCTLTASDWTLTHAQVYPFASSTPISGLSVSSTSLIATARSTAQQADPDTYVLSIGTDGLLTPSAQYDTATSSKHGPVEAVFAEPYIFTVHATESDFSTCRESATCSQLQVLTINGGTVQTAGSLLLPTNSPPYISGSNGQSNGNTITYAAGYVYLGLTKDPNPLGDEFNILDARSGIHLKWLGGYHVGRTITSIIVRGVYAYVTTDDPSSDLLVLNIHDPAHIQKLGYFDAPDKSIYSYSQSAAFASSSLLIGRSYAPNQPELLLASVASITTPFLLATAQFGSTSTPSSVADIYVHYPLAFTLASSKLDIWSIDDAALVHKNQLDLPNESIGTSLTCVGKTVYISSISADSTSYVTALSP